MNSTLFIQMLIHVLGGLGLFLLGMKDMSEGMQSVAGERLRRLIRAVTENRLVAAGVGASITALIQSSSVTTVMVMGFVNAGLMTLKQAVGVIMGTNIGTTVTAWLIAIHIVEYGLPILGVSALFFLFSKRERVRNIAMVFLGLGMVFYGLELMKNGLAPLRSMPEVHAALAAFAPTTLWGLLKCVLVGGMVTAIIQSSSATIAITITLAATGTLSYETAIALVLGQNIGTTVTAGLASLGASNCAKRTALAHFMFNAIGVAILLPLFHQYLWILGIITPDTTPIAARIAMAHTFFNVFVLSLLLPLITPFSRLIELMLPDAKKHEKHHLTYLDLRLLDSAAIAIQQSGAEIERMGDTINRIFDNLDEALKDGGRNPEREEFVFQKEIEIDIMQKEIVEFVSQLMSESSAHQVTEDVRRQLRMADEYESISDYLAGTMKLICRMKNEELAFSQSGMEEILAIHTKITAYFYQVHEAYKHNDTDILIDARSEGESLIHKIKAARANHLARFQSNEAPPRASLIFMDMLTGYRRLLDHTYNVAEVLGGIK